MGQSYTLQSVFIHAFRMKVRDGLTNVLHRQGEILESTTNKLLIHATVNGDCKREQQSGMFATRLSKGGGEDRYKQA
jgi:hypothetical protein